MAKRRLNRRGETLGETLCAVLVLALGVALLGTMIATSSRLDRKTDLATAKLYAAFSKAEAQSETLQNGSVTVTVGSQEKTVDVEFYGDRQQLLSYRLKQEGGSPGA